VEFRLVMRGIQLHLFDTWRAGISYKLNAGMFRVVMFAPPTVFLLCYRVTSVAAQVSCVGFWNGLSHLDQKLVSVVPKLRFAKPFWSCCLHQSVEHWDATGRRVVAFGRFGRNVKNKKQQQLTHKNERWNFK